MTGAWKRLRGCAVLELCAAAPEYCLNKLTEAGLRFWDVTPVDALTVRITVPWHSLRRVRHIAGRAQAEIVSEQLHPGLWALPRVIRRPCLLLGWALALLAVLVLPRYVWTVSVSGNELRRAERQHFVPERQKPFAEHRGRPPVGGGELLRRAL